MKLGTTTHPKFRRLQKQLKLPSYAVAGLLEMLWMLASQYADDGDLTRFSNQEIADYCDFEGDADSLVDALVQAKWLDRDADSLRIHDWVDHRPGYIDDKIRKREERAAKRSISGDSPTMSEFVQGQSKDNPGKSSPRQAMPSHGKPSLSHAQPCQAMASQASPNEQSDCGELSGERADLDFLRLGEDRYRDVMRQANALNVAFGTKIESADVLWQLAWIGYACSESVIPGCIEKFKKLKGTDKQVKNPQAWLIGCINRELKKCDIAFDGAVDFVVPYSEVKSKV